MSTMETPREQEWVTGTLSGIIQKGQDKWQAAVMPDGSQYAKNLWTKDQNLVATLSGLIGQRLSILANASHWTMNDGTPVRSLWIESVGQANGAAPVQQPQPPAQPQQQGTTYYPHPQGATAMPTPATPPPVVPQPPPAQPVAAQPQGVSQDVKEQRIHRQTASKVAAIMLTHVAPEERTMSTLLVLSERLVAYYNEGLPTLPEMGGNPASVYGEQPQTLDDLITQAQPDDIPF